MRSAKEKTSVDGYTMRVIEPSHLSSQAMGRVHALMQDVWAEGLGECLYCDTCLKTWSKYDIFGKLEKSQYNLFASELIDRYAPCCPTCNGNLIPIFGENYRKILTNKYKKSQYSSLIIVENSLQEWIGFCDGYVASLDEIYTNDLQMHYAHIPSKTIRKKIYEILGFLPKNIFSLSGIGFRQTAKLSGFDIKTLVFDIMRRGFEEMKAKGVNAPGIIEVHSGHFLESICLKIGGKKISIPRDLTILKRYKIPENYQTQLIVFANPLQQFQQFFSQKNPKTSL